MRSVNTSTAERRLRAVAARDSRCDGEFVFAVRTTGVFCRPGCGARTPRPENVEFFDGPEQAIRAGFRPCKRCEPLGLRGATPQWIEPLFELLERAPQRVTSRDLEAAGVHPVRAARWFKEHFGMTFHGYQRALRIGASISALRDGADVSSSSAKGGFDSESGFRDAFRKLLGDAPTRLASSVRVVRVRRVPTPLGDMLAAACDDGLCLLEFIDRDSLPRQLDALRKRVSPAIAAGEHELLERVAAELEGYFAGELREFSTPVFAPGTPFQERVWSELRRIPWGETRSYAELARAVGRPSAVRAVASANARNRLAIVVPCHRVIASNGDLAGYAGQVWRKQRLLRLECAR